MVLKRGSTTGKGTFAGQSMLGKVMGTVLAPLVLGGVSGLLLGASAPAYWVVQVAAAIGGFFGGFEHHGWRPGLIRGVAGGLLYGVALLAVRALTGWTDTIDLGGVPDLLVVITALAGAVAGALGGVMRARR
ncbi:hypothetical protein [Amycolatopsis sp. CA-128772]|uniref:hypothetical protein n=1 Tax=Amycolatopsis sp. CA-128772 TaxID=2073159 RepID=UPI000CD21BBB|nr:hypothetical protein [Amycolatopsis sp. CA-128772]